MLAETLNFAEAKPQEKSPQLREKIYRDEAGVITGIEDGDYTFIVGQGDAEGIQMRSVDLDPARRRRRRRPARCSRSALR